MIITGSKYGSVKQGTAAAATNRPPQRPALLTPDRRLLLARRRAGRGQQGTRRMGGVGTHAPPAPGGAAKATAGAGTNIFVPKPGQLIRWDEFMWKELREGGYLQRYIEQERHTSVARQRQSAKAMQGYKQNPKSDLQLLARVPAREYFRWKEEDPHFWEDDKNLRSLRRDNPDLRDCIKV